MVASPGRFLPCALVKPCSSGRWVSRAEGCSGLLLYSDSILEAPPPFLLGSFKVAGDGWSHPKNTGTSGRERNDSDSSLRGLKLLEPV